LSFEIFQSVDADANDAQAIIPCFDNLVIDPFSIGGIASDENNRTRLPFHLTCDPFLNRVITAVRDGIFNRQLKSIRQSVLRTLAKRLAISLPMGRRPCSMWDRFETLTPAASASCF